MTTFFEDIKAYVGFDDDDVRVLLSLHPVVAPHFEKIADHFYDRILAHPRAHAAITGGMEQVKRLKKTLVAWMDLGLRGPYDEAYYERRARIGRRHVEIALPQQYMVTAIDVMRMDFRRVLAHEFRDDRTRFTAAIDAIDRLFDLELAIMLQTYRIDSEERLRRRERLATIGQIAASIGHDLRNPLGVIESSLFILRRRIKDDDRANRHIEKIARQVQNCDRIVTDLLDMARNNPPKTALVDINAVFDDALSTLQIPPLIEIRREISPDLELYADPGLLQQALVNLVTNSMRALSPNPGTIVFEAKVTDDDHIALSMSDNGPGFERSILPLAFEPLVSSGAKGIGLGLALVKSVAERHGGKATAENRSEGGARVTLHLPRQAASKDEEGDA